MKEDEREARTISRPCTVLSVYYFCAVIRGKNGGAFESGLHNELRKESNAIILSCIF